MESPSDKPIFDSREDAHTPFDAEGSEALEAELNETKAGEHHNSNLFDQDEDRAGEKVDLATGTPIDNSTDHGLGGLTIHQTPHVESDDKNDAAAKWLRENDPEKKQRY
jgi:hypothetical protein